MTAATTGFGAAAQRRTELLHQLIVAQFRLRAPLPRPSAIGLQRPAELRPQHIHARMRHPATSRTPSSAGRPDPSPDSPARALRELPQLVPVPPFFEELHLQLDPHGHLSQLRPGPHQPPRPPGSSPSGPVGCRPGTPAATAPAPAARPEPPGSPRRCPPPRRSRNTTSAFRCALHRFGRPNQVA